MSDQVIHSLVSTLNSNIKILYTKTYTFNFEAYGSGTIGTRVAQKSVDLSSDIATHGAVTSLFISTIDNSQAANYQAFINFLPLYIIIFIISLFYCFVTTKFKKLTESSFSCIITLL